jgi:polysaccharide biosynthesis transport protein
VDGVYKMNDMFFEETSQEEEGIDFSRYWQIVLKRKWLIIITFVVIVVPWFIYLKQLPPTYEAYCDIEFKSLVGKKDENVIDHSRIIKLRSRSFAEQVVAQLGLTLKLDPKAEGVERRQLFKEFITDLQPKTGDYLFRWDNSGNYTIHRLRGDREELVDQGTVIEASLSKRQTKAGFSFLLSPDLSSIPQEIKFKILNFRLTVESFQQRTKVGFEGANILRLTMTDHDPFLVAQMVNSLADIYMEKSKSIKETMLEQQKKLIEEKLKLAEAKLNESQNKLQEFQSTHGVSLDDKTKQDSNDLKSYESNITVLQKYLKDLDELLGQLDIMGNSEEDKERIKYIYQQLVALETFKNNPQMGIYQRQLADKERQYSEIVATYSESHTKAIEANRAILDLYPQIKQEAISHRQTLNKDIQTIQSRISHIKGVIDGLPIDNARWLELQREYNDDVSLYRDLKNKLDLSTIDGKVDDEHIEILDRSIVPDTPVNRDKKQKAVMGGAFALIVSFGIAFGLEFLDKSIKTADDVKRYLKLNVLGTIPNIDFRDGSDYQDAEKLKMIDQQLVTYDYSPTPIGEAYRSLRTNLVFSKSNGRIQSFVITSTAAGDGKSFTASNLAISIAQHKSNTLLIDADLRRGVLHNTFGVPKEPGFTNYLTNMVTLPHIINETLIPNLSLISCGSLLPNPSELLGSPQMKRFLDDVRRKFDVVIFDSPPLNAATDAIVIGTQVDAAVVVIRSGVTNRNLARNKLDLFKSVPAKVLGIILNGTSNEFGHDGYSYYHY